MDSCLYQTSKIQFHRFVPSISKRHQKRVASARNSFSISFPGRKVIFFNSTVSKGRQHACSNLRFSNTGFPVDEVPAKIESERPPFDINLAVVLAGFAFEAYTTPPENIGRREVGTSDCKTVYLSEVFFRELYDGQLLVKLKKGINLPKMDPWGTSDPYVVMQLDSQVSKSKIKWGTKEPTWNEEFTFNIKTTRDKFLQVAAWDANLVTPHKRMGYSGVNLGSLCDGNFHEVLMELEGMGGGGKIQLEVKYKTFEEIEEDKKWWKLPFVSDLLRIKGFDSALKKIVGSETVQARQFVEYAFGQLKSLNDLYPGSGKNCDNGKNKHEGSVESKDCKSDLPSEATNTMDSSLGDAVSADPDETEKVSDVDEAQNPLPALQRSEQLPSDELFWKSFSDIINQNIGKRIGLPIPEKLKWDGFEFLDKIGLQLSKTAEEKFIESGLATPEGSGDKDQRTSNPPAIPAIQSSVPDIKRATQDLLRQTDSILGGLMLLTAAVAQAKEQRVPSQDNEIKEEISTKEENQLQNSNDYILSTSQNGSQFNEKKAEEMKALFSTAESAMEAWAMLGTSLGHPSFIKSEFEKICFLDNTSTDTQVAIWRDSTRRRLVVAFRGTEQTRWKDLITDLMLAPTGFNPERIGGDFKQELQVHSGFLSAYDSVRIRIISLIRLAIGYLDDDSEPLHKWHIYVTGHSLGGALATLLALELSCSQLSKVGAISVTMYNFGSPRVGNKRFAEAYNEKVKDSWRVVNHRDIIPTVPRLMGYCHVAQPIYLATGDLENALENMELLGDGYEGDIIGESTPDVIVSEFMKGEKELVEKILQTEINIFRAIRDGSAVMQHMEDFYYITLLENVRLNYQPAAMMQSGEQK